jgi:hypothetical protein
VRLLSFDYIKEQLKGRSFAEDKELLLAFSELISAILPHMIVLAFADWNRKLRLCLLKEGQYVE